MKVEIRYEPAERGYGTRGMWEVEGELTVKGKTKLAYGNGDTLEEAVGLFQASADDAVAER